MRIAIEAAKFTPDEANKLRHAMATFRKRGTIDQMRDQFVDGMTRRGYEHDFAERCFKQIEGFGDYGFPESHSASFSKLVYVSSWLKCHFPRGFRLRPSEQPAHGFLCAPLKSCVMPASMASKCGKWM